MQTIYHLLVLCITLEVNFLPPPLLPHGLNRIIVGHDAKIGANVMFFQGVTISHGGCVFQEAQSALHHIDSYGIADFFLLDNNDARHVQRRTKLAREY